MMIAFVTDFWRVVVEWLYRKAGGGLDFIHLSLWNKMVAISRMIIQKHIL